jgi:hypothetical protein
MHDDAFRDATGADPPETYWRRRVVALIAGFGLIGLLAWALAGGGGKSATPPAGSAQTYRLLPAVASHSAAAWRTAAATSPSARPGASGSPSPAATQTANAAGPLTPGPSPGAGQEPSGLCAPGTVVLSVFSTRSSYSGREDPRFNVYAVSTAMLPCTFDLGPSTLHLEVMSSGRVIWDSGDCARSDSTWTAKLSRGVPVVESITWSRTITLPGCVTLTSSVRAGTYQARASTTSLASAVLSFRLVP